MEAERVRVCAVLGRSARRASIVFGVLLACTLAGIALVVAEVRLEPLVLVVIGVFALVPSLIAASVVRGRRRALRFVRGTSPLLIHRDDDGGLVVLSAQGLRHRDRLRGCESLLCL